MALKIAAIVGILVTIFHWCIGYYIDVNYDMGLDLDFYKKPLFIVFFAAICFFFWLNYRYAKTAFKKELFGAFCIIILLFIGMVASFIRDMSADKEKTNNNNLLNKGLDLLFGGMFESKNPPPAWLEQMQNITGLLIPTIAFTCFFFVTKMYLTIRRNEKL